MIGADCIRRHQGGISYIGRAGVMNNEAEDESKRMRRTGDPDTDTNVSHAVLQDA
ncbi:MAG: hypothetical protein OJF50_001116 [Nitrospira sp.]|nr:hypothetical protein [Nitrospira sp.]